jgi:hypothetical protein
MASLQNRRKFSEREQGILEGHKEEGGVGGRETIRKNFFTLPSRPWLQKGDDGVFPMA